MNCNKKQAKEIRKRTREFLKYSKLTRYVLLQSFALYNSSPKLDFIEDLLQHELSKITDVVNILERIFQKNFDKMLDVDTPKHCELDYPKFLLSRCALLCPKPTYSSFLLVSAFLSRFIFREAPSKECCGILYIGEFCLLVLYRRLFRKIFHSVGGYQNLEKFCNEFHKNFTEDSTLSDLRKTRVSENWINVVQDCVNATDVHFSLKDIEIKVFEECYSSINYMEYKSENLQKIESVLFPFRCDGCKKKSFCKYCGCKCHNYLVHARQFICKFQVKIIHCKY
ncbi:hypothetical protein TNCT_114901 [Trichonephila clavata]|uniref:Uncharacterized protein n=1 Tax=Trichonephila clavata TaxID=2740835 RepID=A0A8X6GGJ5_TRICU|nr:hypothetical protein TNCT_114901 [Trichonephila clavata]